MSRSFNEYYYPLLLITSSSLEIYISLLLTLWKHYSWSIYENSRKKHQRWKTWKILSMSNAFTQGRSNVVATTMIRHDGGFDLCNVVCLPCVRWEYSRLSGHDMHVFTSRTHQTYDVYATSHEPRCNAMALHRRWYDVSSTSYACWGYAGHIWALVLLFLVNK